MTKFYRLTDDMYLENRWYLNGVRSQVGTSIDSRIFTYGKPIHFPGKLNVGIRSHGTPLDFTLADFGLPVLRTDLAEELVSLVKDVVQLFHVTIDGQEKSYSIINVVSTVPCLDENIDGIMYWGETDGRPEKVGGYRMVPSIKVVPQRIRDQEIFRISGWEVALIVSERVGQFFSSVQGAKLGLVN